MSIGTRLGSIGQWRGRGNVHISRGQEYKQDHHHTHLQGAAGKVDDEYANRVSTSVKNTHQAGEEEKLVGLVQERRLCHNDDNKAGHTANVIRGEREN